MAEKDLNPPVNVPMTDPETGLLTLQWQAFISLLVSKIKALETP